MSFAFWTKKEAASTDFAVISAHSNRIFEPENGYLATFKRDQSHRYFIVRTDFDSFIEKFLAKKLFVETELERINNTKTPNSEDYQVMEKVFNDVCWLRLAIYGDDNFSGDFRCLGLLNFLAGSQREQLPLLRKVAVWTKHTLVGQTLRSET